MAKRKRSACIRVTFWRCCTDLWLTCDYARMGNALTGCYYFAPPDRCRCKAAQRAERRTHG